MKLRQSKGDNVQKSVDERLGLEAAEWLLRFEEEASRGPHPYHFDTALDEAFSAWLGRSPDHPRVYQETAAARLAFKAFDPERRIDVEALLHPEHDKPVGTHRRFPIRRVGIGVAIAASLVGLGIGLTLSWKTTATSIYFATSKGEVRVVTLEDGTKITLSADSKIAVASTTHSRGVTLLQGEALFEVQHDPKRPFQVQTADTVIKDIGTQFDVDVHETGTTVSVLEGEVSVQLHTPSSAKPAIRSEEVVRAGERGEIAKDANAQSFNRTKLSQAQITSTTAWREGFLILDDLPLSEAVERINRYYPQRMVVTDPTIARIPVGGVFTHRPPFQTLLGLLRETYHVGALPSDLHQQGDSIRLISMNGLSISQANKTPAELSPQQDIERH